MIEWIMNFNCGNQSVSDIILKLIKLGGENIDEVVSGSYNEKNSSLELIFVLNFVYFGSFKFIDFGNLSNKVLYFKLVGNEDDNCKRGDIFLVVKQYSMWIVFLVSILLCVFILLLVYIIGKRRCRKLMIVFEDCKCGLICSCIGI